MTILCFSYTVHTLHSIQQLLNNLTIVYLLNLFFHCSLQLSFMPSIEPLYTLPSWAGLDVMVSPLSFQIHWNYFYDCFFIVFIYYQKYWSGEQGTPQRLMYCLSLKSIWGGWIVGMDGRDRWLDENLHCNLRWKLMGWLRTSHLPPVNSRWWYVFLLIFSARSMYLLDIKSL